MKRCYRRYRGVAIHRRRDMVCGSDFDFDSNGVMVSRRPQYDVYFTLADGSFRSDTLAEIKDDIDRLFILEDSEEMRDVLNHEG